MSPAPIALFVYRRPDHTRRTLRALEANSLAGESDLIVFSDGAKEPRHTADVAAVRALLRQDWRFRSVTVVERDRNYGLAKSISEGVGKLCKEHGRAIVIEDDIALAPDGLSFLNEGLARYAQDERVWQVSAYSYPADFSGCSEAFFLPMTSCWGWATWERAWRNFDPSMPGLDRLHADAKLRRRFDIDGSYDYYAMACQQARGEIDSWGICWQFNAFMNDALVLYPRQSLATNLGVDSSGTHGTGDAALQAPLVSTRVDVGSLDFPVSVQADQEALSRVADLLAPLKPGWMQRVANWMRA